MVSLTEHYNNEGSAYPVQASLLWDSETPLEEFRIEIWQIDVDVYQVCIYECDDEIFCPQMSGTRDLALYYATGLYDYKFAVMALSGGIPT